MNHSFKIFAKRRVVTLIFMALFIGQMSVKGNAQPPHNRDTSVVIHTAVFHLDTGVLERSLVRYFNPNVQPGMTEKAVKFSESLSKILTVWQVIVTVIIAAVVAVVAKLKKPKDTKFNWWNVLLGVCGLLVLVFVACELIYVLWKLGSILTGLLYFLIGLGVLMLLFSFYYLEQQKFEYRKQRDNEDRIKQNKENRKSQDKDIQQEIINQIVSEELANAIRREARFEIERYMKKNSDNVRAKIWDAIIDKDKSN